MKKQQLNKKKTEVYSISGFKDTLASPVFYPVIVVALVLGVTSIFGFVQNPLKLKSMVNVIHQKVAKSNVVNDSFNNKLYNVTERTQSLQPYSESLNSFELFSDIEENKPQKMSVSADIERIAFNYDVTSESFWADLDSSKLETATEEMERKEKEAISIGAPLEIDIQEHLPSEYNLQDSSIYALHNQNKI